MKKNINANNAVINSIMRNSFKYLCAVVMILGMSVNAWGWTITLYKGIGGYTTTSHTGGVALPSYSDVGSWTAQYLWMKTEYNSSSYPSYGTYYAVGDDDFTDAYNLHALYYYNGTYSTTPEGASRTISFSVGYGSAPSSRSGGSITLPAIPALCSDATDAGWIPYGWATASVANNSSSASVVGTPGDTYYPDADRTLYAVYKQPGTLSSSTSFTLNESGGTSVSPYDKYMPTEGYAILTQVQQPASAISNTLTGNYISHIGSGEVTYSTSMTTSNSNCVWEVDMPADGDFRFKNIVTGQYLGLAEPAYSGADETNGALVANGSSDYAKWNVAKTSSKGFFLVNKGCGYYLRYVTGSNGWRGYKEKHKDGSIDNVYIWVKNTVTTSGDKYQSSLPMCGFQVTYNGNGKDGGGNPPTDNTVYTSGATVTVLGNTNSMTKTGYTFSGWNTSPDGNGTDRAVSSTFSITSDVTLYAKWVAKEYTVNLNKDGGSGGSTSVTATYNAAMPSAGSAPTFSGYTFGGYYTAVGGSGTQYYDATPASAHVWDVDVNPSTIYAKWTQVVTLDKNTGSSDRSVTVTYKGSGTSSFTAVTKTGYDCTGYWDNTSGGNKIITDAGALVSYSASVSSYINSDGKWCHSGATTLYAQWSAKTYTVTLNQGIGSSGTEEVTATFGSAMPSATMPTAPDGYTFAGYYYGETIYYNADGSSARTWDIAAPTTLTAHYTTNTPTLSVAEVDDVTITATPSGDDAIGENDSKAIAYNTSVALASSSLTTNYYFEGWDVYETGNSGNKVTVTNNSFTMPNYPVTVSAIVRSNTSMKAWCPVITLTKTDGGASPILVTSVAGKSIKGVRTLHLTVTGAVTSAAVVTLSGTDLEFYKSDGTQITGSNLTCSSYALDATIYVAYNPTGDYTDDSWSAPDITASCSSTDVTVSDLVNVRRLPDNGTGNGQGFVIAAKVGDEWVALPSAMSAGAQDGLPITVDDDEDPTEVTLAPSSARYNLNNVYKSNGANDRHKVYGTYAYLVGNGSKVLKSASSGTNISLGVNASTYSGGSADAAYFEWLLSTTDKKNYTITNNGRTAQLKYYTTHDKFGMYAYNSQVITEFRLLPATFYTEAPMQVVEWKANSVVVMYTGAETTATTQVGNNEESSSQTLANNKLTHGIYELTTDQALTSNDGAQLLISFGDGSTKKIVEVPIIIAGTATATDGHAAQDVVICNGGKLTAAASSYDYYNVYVYGGGKLDIPTGTSLGVNSLIMRAGGLSTSGIGSSPSATYQYIYPQVGLIGTLACAEDTIRYEYLTDYDHWYQFCLPFDGKLSTIHYPVEYYGENVAEGNTGSWIVKRYAGEIRATGNYNAWVDIETESATAVSAGHGYIFWGAPKKISVGGASKPRSKWGIQRIAMPIADFSTAASAEAANKSVGDLSSYSSVPGNSGQLNDQGWNLIGNPYMVNLSGLSTTSLKTGKLIHVDDAGGNWTGRWESNGDSYRYITVPSEHFETYEARALSYFDGTTLAKTLQAGQTFFVQMDGANTAVQFDASKRKALMPALLASTDVDVETGIIMSDESHTDELNFWIKDGKTAAYDNNADYPKTMNQTNFNIYGVHEVGNLSWVAISPEIAEDEMPVGYQVPIAGDYWLSLSDSYGVTDLEHVYVTDHEASPEITTDLLYEAYEFHVNQAETNNTRFTISIKLKNQNPDDPENPGMGIEDVRQNGDSPMKFIYHDKMYILRNGVIYDATGKRVSEINK